MCLSVCEVWGVGELMKLEFPLNRSIFIWSEKQTLQFGSYFPQTATLMSCAGVIADVFFNLFVCIYIKIEMCCTYLRCLDL